MIILQLIQNYRAYERRSALCPIAYNGYAQSYGLKMIIINK